MTIAYNNRKKTRKEMKRIKNRGPKKPPQHTRVNKKIDQTRPTEANKE